MPVITASPITPLERAAHWLAEKPVGSVPNTLPALISCSRSQRRTPCEPSSAPMCCVRRREGLMPRRAKLAAATPLE